MGLFSSKKSKPSAAQPIRRDRARNALNLGMVWYGGDPDGDAFVANRNRYYRALKGCTPAEVEYVEDALRRNGYQP